MILLVCGCSVPETDPSRYKCDWIDEHKSWSCVKDGVKFTCEYEQRRK